MSARRRTNDLFLGFRTHLGWAAGVALAGPANEPRVVDRRRIDLHDENVRESFEPYHKAAEAPREDAETIVRVGTQAIHRAARREVRAWVRALERDGARVRSAAVLMSSAVTASFESTLASHALVHVAEGNLMREALLDASERCELALSGPGEKSLVLDAARQLGTSDTKLKRALDTLGAGLGPPWRQDQKLAALGAWLVLAS